MVGTSDHVQLQLDVLAGPVTALTVAAALYQTAKSTRRRVDWSLVTFSPALQSVTPLCKAAAIASVVSKSNQWWQGAWWCGSQLGPFWDRLAFEQNPARSGLGQALLAMALEMSSVMSATETAEVVLSLLQASNTATNMAVVKSGDGARELVIGDVMPALRELGDQGSRAYMKQERATFEKAILRQLGDKVPLASTVLMGTYTPPDVQAAIRVTEELMSASDGSVSEVSCQAGAIKLGFLIYSLFGVAVTVVCEGPSTATVRGTQRPEHTFQIRASNRPAANPRLFTPLGSLLSTQNSYSYNHAVHAEACVEHISVILCRWQHHWGVSQDSIMVFSRCLLSALVQWRRECALEPSLYHKSESSKRLGAPGYDSSGYKKPIMGFRIRSVVTVDELVEVYRKCLGEYAPEEDQILSLISEEEDIVRQGPDHTYRDKMLIPMLTGVCLCYRHLPSGKSRPSGYLGCATDDGHSLFAFISAAMRVLTLVDIEQPLVPSQRPGTTSLAIPSVDLEKSQLGYVYHGDSVRRAVRSLPDGQDQTVKLTFAQILHAAAWLFAGPAGGSVAENENLAGICANGVAVVGSFYFRPTLSERDCRIHVSFGQTLFQGAQVQRLSCYGQNVYGVLPPDSCLGRPWPSKGMTPSLEGLDNAEMTPVVNLRDDIATLAYRIQWMDLAEQEPRDILVSPENYLRGLGWHLHFLTCEHDPDTPVETDGVIRVCRAGVFPQEPSRDMNGKIQWPKGYIPSPNLSTLGGFTRCLARTKGCREIHVATVCHAGASRSIVIQRGCCIECACSHAATVGAILVMCI